MATLDWPKHPELCLALGHEYTHLKALDNQGCASSADSSICQLFPPAALSLLMLCSLSPAVEGSRKGLVVHVGCNVASLSACMLQSLCLLLPPGENLAQPDVGNAPACLLCNLSLVLEGLHCCSPAIKCGGLQSHTV